MHSQINSNKNHPEERKDVKPSISRSEKDKKPKHYGIGLMSNLKWSKLLKENPYNLGGDTHQHRRPDYFHPILNPLIGAFQNLNRITGAHCRNIKMALDILTLPFNDYGTPIGRLQGGLWIYSRLLRILKPWKAQDCDMKQCHQFCKVESEKVTRNMKSLLLEMEGTYAEMKKYWLDYLLYRERLRQYRMKTVQDYYDEGRLSKETGQIKGWYRTGDCPAEKVVILENYEEWMSEVNEINRINASRPDHQLQFEGSDANYLKRKEFDPYDDHDVGSTTGKQKSPEDYTSIKMDSKLSSDKVPSSSKYHIPKGTVQYDFLWLPEDKCYIKRVKKEYDKTDWYDFDTLSWDMKKDILEKVFYSINEMTKLAKWHFYIASRIMMKEGTEVNFANSAKHTFAEECFITINKYHRLLQKLDRVSHSDPFRVGLLHVSLNEWYLVRDSMSHLRRFMKFSINWIKQHHDLIPSLSTCQSNVSALRYFLRKYHVLFPFRFSNSFTENPKFQRARFSMTIEDDEKFCSCVIVDRSVSFMVRNHLQQMCLGDNCVTNVKPIRNSVFIDNLYWKSVRLGPFYRYLFQQHFLSRATIQINGLGDQAELVDFESPEEIDEIIDGELDLELDFMGFYLNKPSLNKAGSKAEIIQIKKVSEVQVPEGPPNIQDLNTILVERRTTNDAIGFPFLKENRPQTGENTPEMKIDNFGDKILVCSKYRHSR